MNTRLTGKDFRLIVVCIVIAVVATLFVSQNFFKAFPEASIEFKVTRDQSKDIAEEFLAQINFDTDGYRHATMFSYQNEAKVFLEKELGAEKANKLMGDPIRLWRWNNRWYKPLEKEEITVRISPKGEFIGFIHSLPEEAPGERLTADSARIKARRFLSTGMHINMDSLEFVEESSQERPNRLDHTFIWKHKQLTIQEATYRYAVDISGSKVTGYREYLHVPESWSRSYEKLRAKNNTTGMTAAFFLFLTVAAMLVIVIVHTRHGNIRWKTAIWFGSIAAALTFFSSLNNLPLAHYSYSTTESYSSFIVRGILGDFLTALLSGISILIITAAAETLYRERYDNRISLTNLFTWRGLRTKKAFIAVIVGLTLTFFFAAYQVIFYMITDKFGGWAPQDIPYDNMLNTAFPWIFVLLIGFMPAVSEEFISRMFSIPFLQNILKVRWLAVLIPAFIWGFAHANYPQQPFYIRGLEVGIAGIVIGYVMLRYGILAALTWHYTVDALYTAVILFRSGNSYFIITAAVSCSIFLIPLVFMIAAYIKNNGFEPDTNILNKAEGIERSHEGDEEETEDVPTYTPLPRKTLISAGLAGLLLLGLLALPADKFNSFVKFPHGKDKARRAAIEFLDDHQFDVSGYETVVYTSERFDGTVASYVLQHADMERLRRLYANESPGSRWGVRFFKPLQKKEIRVNIDPRDLSLVSFSRTLAEDAPGVSIPQDSARTIAEDFASSQEWDVSNMDLKESSTEKLENRSDHTFVWEAKEGDDSNVNELKLRVMVQLQGNQVSMFTTFPKIPEQYERQYNQRTLVNTALLILRIGVLVGLIVIVTIHFVREAKVGNILWNRSLIYAAIAGVLFLLTGLSRLQVANQYYVTSMEMSLFRISFFIGILITAIVVFIGLGLMLGFISALYPKALHTLKQPVRRLFARDAFVTSLIAIAGFFGLRELSVFLTNTFSKHAIITSLNVPGYLNLPLPFLDSLQDVYVSTILTASLVAIFVYIFHTVLKKPLWIALFVVASLCAAIPSHAQSWGEILLFFGKILPMLLWIFLIIFALAKNNYLAYILIPLLLSGLSSVMMFVSQHNQFYLLNGIIVGCLLLVLLAWMLFPMLSSRSKPE